MIDLDDPRLDPYRDLRARGAGDHLIVEGALAVERLLAAAERFELESLVCTPHQRARLAERVELPATLAIFELAREQIAALAGFDFHRGVIACAARPALSERLEAWELEALARRERLTVVVAEQLADPRNLGALIRNAAAFGVDLVIVDRRGADPFSRLAIRASVGNVFRLPLIHSATLPATVEQLRRELDAELVAATPGGAVEIGDFARPKRIQLLVGNEGRGLSPDWIARAEHRVRIDVAEGADSLNVAAATAVLLYGLTRP